MNIERIKKINRQLIRNKDVNKLFKLYYEDQPELTEGQVRIAKAIIFPEHNRYIVNAYTKYGKTWVTARALAIRLTIMKRTVGILAPRHSQTKFLVNYLAEAIVNSPIISRVVDIDRRFNEQKFRKESSKKRQTFKNGSSYEVYSAQGDAERIMGASFDDVITDEDALISEEAQAKIGSRIVRPDDYLWVKLCNPWNKDSHSYDAWTSEKWHNIHIDCYQGIREGRTTKEYIEEKKEDVNVLEWEVLYLSKFPTTSEDQLISGEAVSDSINTEPTEENIDFENFDLEKVLIGVDVADKGRDKTVITTNVITSDRHNHITHITSEDKSDNMQIAKNVVARHEFLRKSLGDKLKFNVVVDGIGVGVGVVSRLREVITHPSTVVTSANYAKKSRSETFRNLKSEKFWQLKKVFEEGRITIPNHSQLRTELLSMRWELDNQGRIKVVDPKRSPDFADSLVYATWFQYKQYTGVGVVRKR